MATDPALPGLLHEAAARVRAIDGPLAETMVSVSMARVSVMWSWEGTASDRDALQAQAVMDRIREAVDALGRLADRLSTAEGKVQDQLTAEAAAKAKADAEAAAKAKAAAAAAAKAATGSV
jgi:hypothetical protein